MRLDLMGALWLLAASGFAAETLGDALRSASVPTDRFTAAELDRKITSYAVCGGDPFLLAYYADDGSGLLQAPLHVVRYARASGAPRQAHLQKQEALFQGGMPMNCFGSALSIQEKLGAVWIETHINPSAGCVIVLSSELKPRAALSGWLLGFVAPDFAVVRASEVHFMAVHPLHIAVYDARRNRSTEVYPFADDAARREFSRSIEPHVSEAWCMQHNAPCDPQNFNATLKGELSVNEAARVFGFEAEFDAGGFGPAAQGRVPARTVVYVYRERGGAWEHRQFRPEELQRLFGVAAVQDLLRLKPAAPFAAVGRK